MDVTPQTVDQLKSISIIGRMALAITCLEIILADFETDDHERQSLLDIFWQFVEDDDVGQWDADWREHQLLNSIIDHVEGFPPSNLQSYSCRVLDEWVYQIICKTCELGISELYMAMVDYGEESHEHLVTILNLMRRNGYNTPPLESFLKSPFDEVKGSRIGWGKTRPRSFFSVQPLQREKD